MATKLYTILDFTKRHQVHQSAKVRVLSWLPMPNGRDRLDPRERQRRRFKQIHGALLGGAMLHFYDELARLVSRLPPELRALGQIVGSDGQPLSARDIAEETGCAGDEPFVQRCLEALTTELRWLACDGGNGQEEPGLYISSGARTDKPSALGANENETETERKGQERRAKSTPRAAPAASTAQDQKTSRSSSDSASTPGSSTPGPRILQRADRNPQPAAAVPRSRRHGDLAWNGTVHRLWGLTGGRRLPESSPQWKADRTSSQSLFDDLIWPSELDLAAGGERLARALALVPKAAENGERPMAWLTQVLRREFGSGAGGEPACPQAGVKRERAP